MTKGFSDGMQRDANCNNVRDHLRNHIHLTNCIHLKNHMHKHSYMLADSALMKDPNAAPLSWRSPSVVDVLGRDALFDGTLRERPRTSKRSPRINGSLVTKVTKAGRSNSSKNGIHGCRTVKRGESSRWLPEDNVMGCNSGHPRNGIDLVNYIVSGRTELRNKGVKKKGAYARDMNVKAQSNHLKDALSDCNHVALSCNCGRRSRVKEIAGEAQTNSQSHGNDVNWAKRRKFQGKRTHNPSKASLPAKAQNKMSEASVQGNGCGSPWNRSRIQHMGKTLSCGFSEPQSRREGPITRGRLISNESEHSNSYIKSDAEALFLLLDSSGSQGSLNHDARFHAYFEELGLSGDDLITKEFASDFASGVYGEQRKLQRQSTHRHQNLTQKYMPRTFGDLVGQNLVAQALSNVVIKRKVGLLYVFYGPHGTGKTTCARIFARALNCESPDSPKPCGSCDPCIVADMGKSKNVMEVSPVRNLDFNVIELLGSTIASRHHSDYRIFILDDCDALSTDCWSAVLKTVDRAPRQVVFILVCSSLDVLPHVLISRCQKFYFPKLKDADIIHTLQGIAAKEDLEIDKDALKLIALRSDGSLRDAEMTLEQLSLLSQRISLCLVQELVGLISDEKLVDLLDLALTADSVNTVKNLRDIMESGVEPLVLMSQLASVITDILAGSYDMIKERQGRKFFRQPTLSREDLEKLRRALKTLSEAEKQLRLSNDRITWLTAAVLQLAPDQPCTLPSPPADANLNKSKNHESESQLPHNLEEFWLEVLDKIPIRSIKEFMHQEGKMISIGHGAAAPTVELLFSSQLTRSKAEKFTPHILQAFESALKSPVTIEIKCDSTKDTTETGPIPLPASDDQRKDEGNRNPSLSLVRSKVSLAHIILQHTEGSSQHSGWLKHKAFSIAQKLEQQNLKLESRSKTLLCWRPPIRLSGRKISRLKIRARRPQMLLKSVCYGRCLSGMSPR